jgi:hypothetical protein
MLSGGKILDIKFLSSSVDLPTARVIPIKIGIIEEHNTSEKKICSFL